MAVYEALLLNTVVPQIQAAQAGDSYVMVVNATTPALRITQTGTGNAISVEDEANPDSSPFVVTAAGDVGIGLSSPTVKLDVVGSAKFAGSYVSFNDNGYIRTDAANILRFQPGSGGYQFRNASNSDNLAVLDASGNLGLGVTPSAWDAAGAGGPVLQIQRALLFGANTETRLIHNAYYGTGDFRYIASGVAATNYQQQSGQHRWYTAPSGTAGNAISFTQAMTLDASGNLVVGATSAPSRVTVAQGTTPTDFSTVAVMVGGTGADSYVVGALHNIGFLYDSTSSAKPAVAIGHVITSDAGATKGALVFATRDVTTDTAPTERARITSGGDLLVGTNSGQVAATVVSYRASAAVSCVGSWSAATSGDNLFQDFYTEATATLRGSIDYNRAGGLTRYNTTSDYRAKDVYGLLQNTGNAIDALKVYNGKMKGATQERPMLIAHEAQEVAPYAVSGEKDAVNADGTPKYQQMDVSSLVPLLIAEIQSLRARVAQLEAK
jgi:hypothetical protein